MAPPPGPVDVGVSKVLVWGGGGRGGSVTSVH